MGVMPRNWVLKLLREVLPESWDGSFASLFASVILTVGSTVMRVAEVASAVVSLAERLGSTPGCP